jgi:hypothetical protein
MVRANECQRRALPWGEHFFPLPPGEHQLQVSYRHLRLPRAGQASVKVNVAPNEVTHAFYQAPRSVLVAFLPGKLSIESPAQA